MFIAFCNGMRIMAYNITHWYTAWKKVTNAASILVSQKIGVDTLKTSLRKILQKDTISMSPLVLESVV